MGTHEDRYSRGSLFTESGTHQDRCSLPLDESTCTQSIPKVVHHIAQFSPVGSVRPCSHERWCSDAVCCAQSDSEIERTESNTHQVRMNCPRTHLYFLCLSRSLSLGPTTRASDSDDTRWQAVGRIWQASDSKRELIETHKQCRHITPLNRRRSDQWRPRRHRCRCRSRRTRRRRRRVRTRCPSPRRRPQRAACRRRSRRRRRPSHSAS